MKDGAGSSARRQHTGVSYWKPQAERRAGTRQRGRFPSSGMQPVVCPALHRASSRSDLGQNLHSRNLVADFDVGVSVTEVA